jgi:ketosteroid isomerase-like protein
MFLASALIAALLQAAPSSGSVDPEKEPFQTLETRVSGAIQAKNVAALDELLAKDFAFMAFLEGRAPLVLNRGEWLKTSEHYALVGFEIRHLAARVFGKVAVVRLQPYRTAVAGASLDRSGEFAVVDVWTRDGDAWKLSARHLSRPDALKR